MVFEVKQILERIEIELKNEGKEREEVILRRKFKNGALN